MTINDITRLYDYTYWANGKLLAVVTQLTPEQFTQNVAGSYGSVRNTLVHVMSAEWGWLERAGGAKRGPALKPADYPTPLSLTDQWRDVERNLRAFIAGLKDADLERVVEYKNPAGETRSAVLGPMLQHAAIHGVHHRGQVSLLLRVLGFAPGNFDLVLYDAEKRGVSAF